MRWATYVSTRTLGLSFVSGVVVFVLPSLVTRSPFRLPEFPLVLGLSQEFSAHDLTLDLWLSWGSLPSGPTSGDVRSLVLSLLTYFGLRYSLMYRAVFDPDFCDGWSGRFDVPWHGRPSPEYNSPRVIRVYIRSLSVMGLVTLLDLNTSGSSPFLFWGESLRRW